MTEKKFKNEISSEELAHLIGCFPSYVDGKFLSREGNLKLLYKQLFTFLAKNGGKLLINNASIKELAKEDNKHSLNFVDFYEGKAFKFASKIAGEFESSIDELINTAKNRPLQQMLAIVDSKADADLLEARTNNVLVIRQIGNGAYFVCSEKTADLLLADYSEL